MAQIYLYQDAQGHCLLREWLDELERRDLDSAARCRAAIMRLETMGHLLRRPHADYLRDDIHELRIRSQRVHFRILYFFRGKDIIVLSHAFGKRGKVPSEEIARALRHKAEIELGLQNPTPL